MSNFCRPRIGWKACQLLLGDVSLFIKVNELKLRFDTKDVWCEDFGIQMILKSIVLVISSNIISQTWRDIERSPFLSSVRHGMK